MTKSHPFSAHKQRPVSGLRTLVPCGLLAFGLISIAPSLAAEDTPVLKSKGPEITIPVVVRDKHDKLITGLAKDDFTLTEDGKPQTIKSLIPASSQPITLGILVDTSAAQRNNIDQIKAATKQFLQTIMTNPQDKAFLLHFDREVELLQDTTAHRDKLLAAVDLLSAASVDEPVSKDDSDDSKKRWKGPSDTLYDSIYLAGDELLRKQQGRKVLVLISEGGDRNSKVSAVMAIEAAQQSNTVIYAVYLKGEETSRNSNSSQDPNNRRRTGSSPWPGGGSTWPGGGGGPTGTGGGGNRIPQVEAKKVDGRKTLEHIATKTGGHILEANKKDNLNRAFGDLSEELHSQYLMTYSPAQPGGGSFHQVSLVPKKKDLSVQIQDGYYPGQ